MAGTNADENVALSGAVYAKATSVIASSTYLIADFRGNVAFDMPMEFADWKGQNLVKQDRTMTGLGVTMSISEVAWKPGTLTTLLGITAAAASMLDAAASAATMWSITESLAPPDLQYLYHFTGGDGQDQQWKIMKGQLQSNLPFAFGNTDYITHDFTVEGFATAAGTLVEVRMQS